jgi:hypothetical protein
LRRPARYEEWSAKTAGTRETAGKAKAELQRRGHEPAPTETLESQSALEWWREFQARVEVADRTLARQQQAAIEAGRQWPSVRHPQAQPEAEHATRLDELQVWSDDAAARIEARRAELDASKEYTARMECEAHPEPEAGRQADAPDEIEMEPP